ncbi:outer membrane protein assembly factor BamB family protein [Pseudoduganella sp. RAF53_2]|uniref:outer membrane protein assembly factor BamB family protein n=1 Tax=unclassified Pseudoduganella TaxID=2637179 RepID=UPI003F9B31E4
MFHETAKIGAAIALALTLNACGGGGGSDAGNSGAPVQQPTGPVAPTPSPEQSWLTITPPTTSLSIYEGEVQSFNITATSNKTISTPINIAIVDKKGVISTDVHVEALSQLQYRATLQTSSILAVGTYSTSLELRLCEDNPTVCSKPITGSPWQIPIQVTVKPGTALTPLKALPGLAGWTTFQGNAAHTGYVPANFNAANFARRWSGLLGRPGDTVEFAHDGGMLYGVAHNANTGHYEVFAINEETRQDLWRKDMGTLYQVNPVAIGNGKVYVTSAGHQDTYFWEFDQATGSLVSKTALSSQWEKYKAPTVVGQNVYTNSGYYGGMVKFDSVNHSVAWSNYTLPQYDNWTPAVDDNYAYAYMNGALYAVNVKDGATAFKIVDVGNQWSGYDGNVMALAGTRGFVVNSNRLIAFDLTLRTMAWAVNGPSSGMAAYAKDVVYILNANGSVLEARSPADGHLLWSSDTLVGTENDTSFNNIVLTNNLAFVSSNTSTLAIDLATHKTVWNYALGGALSISNRGVLYISNSSGKVAAINLQ